MLEPYLHITCMKPGESGREEFKWVVGLTLQRRLHRCKRRQSWNERGEIEKARGDRMGIMYVLSRAGSWAIVLRGGGRKRWGLSSAQPFFPSAYNETTCYRSTSEKNASGAEGIKATRRPSPMFRTSSANESSQSDAGSVPRFKSRVSLSVLPRGVISTAIPPVSRRWRR